MGKSETNVHYFIFQENFKRAKRRIQHKNNLTFYDCISNCSSWKDPNKIDSFSQILKNLGSRDVVFIDSLAHVIYQYGLSQTYMTLNNIKNHTSMFTKIVEKIPINVHI